MKKFVSSLCAAALGVSLLAAAEIPAIAAPMQPQIQSVASDVSQVQYRRHGFERRGNGAYYNGQRGYRDRRAGYRRHNGFWFPAGAFIAGAIIGNSLNNSSSGARSNVAWCQDRYRSYRVSDNSYLGNDGRRHACNSPY